MAEMVVTLTRKMRGQFKSQGAPTIVQKWTITDIDQSGNHSL